MMPGRSQWAAETPCRKWERESVSAERIPGLVGKELMDGSQWRSKSFSLSSVSGQRLELTWGSLGFSTLGTTCHIKSAASFGDERQRLGPGSEKAFEMYTATSLYCIFSWASTKPQCLLPETDVEIWCTSLIRGEMHWNWKCSCVSNHSKSSKLLIICQIRLETFVTIFPRGTCFNWIIQSILFNLPSPFWQFQEPGRILPHGPWGVDVWEPWLFPWPFVCLREAA